MKKFWNFVKKFLGKSIGQKEEQSSIKENAEQEYIATKCGHRTKLQGYLETFGEKIGATLKLKDGNVEYCHNCLSKMAIQCAWCGKAIFPGSPITLYTPKKDFKILEYAIVYNKNPLQLVGCLRMSCADSGIDRAGFWVVPGEVLRVMSPMEQMLATKSDDIVIVGNLGDIDEAIRQTNETIKRVESKKQE